MAHTDNGLHVYLKTLQSGTLCVCLFVMIVCHITNIDRHYLKYHHRTEYGKGTWLIFSAMTLKQKTH